MKRVYAVLMTILPVFLSGCDLMDDFRLAKEAGKKIASVETQLEHATSRIDFLEKENIDLKKQLENFSEEILSVKVNVPSYAMLNPSSSKFAIAAAPGMFFAVSCDDIAEYASGSKLKLSITNLMGLTVTGINVELRYLPSITDKEGELKDDFMDLLKNTREKIDSISPGTSQTVEMRLPEYKPDQVKALMVSISYEGIRYTQGKK